MQSSNDGSTEFHQELSQLVHKHINDDTKPADLLDALEIQTELVRSRSAGPEYTEKRAPADPEHNNFSWD